MKKIPLLLYLYLLTEMLAPFFAALLVINAILFLGRLVPLLEVIFGFGIGWADFIRFGAYIAPKLLLFSLPMACMMGVIIAFTRMSGDHEIMALKAGGIGLYRMLPPVLLLSLVAALLTYATATILIPKGTVAMDQLFWQLAKNKIDQGIPAQTFSEGLKDVVIYVQEVSPGDQSWRGVYLSDLRDPQNPVIVVARSGRLSVDSAERRIQLHLSDGTMHRAVGATTQTIHFKRYLLDLPLVPPPAFGQRGDKDSMTQAELRAAALSLAPDHPHRLTLLIEYHQRLVLPVGCFILGILGLTLALLNRTSSQALGVPLGLAAFIVYYVLLTAAKFYIESGQLPLLPTMWAPNLLFGFFTIYLTRRTALELNQPWLERISAVTQGVKQRLPWRSGTSP
ncbi:MAG: YjgP/YjgQ family permease [Desulfobulbaceae bacterium]|nr:MAG: YjgP/YjgQ family permease [Desulfobulbaceae bacterium]